jgi:hypothetical protein
MWWWRKFKISRFSYGDAPHSADVSTSHLEHTRSNHKWWPQSKQRLRGMEQQVLQLGRSCPPIHLESYRMVLERGSDSAHTDSTGLCRQPTREVYSNVMCSFNRDWTICVMTWLPATRPLHSFSVVLVGISGWITSVKQNWMNSSAIVSNELFKCVKH